MRRVIYGGAITLDGFLAGPAGELDWLHFSEEVQKIMQQSFSSADTVLMGRKTWAVSAPPEGAEDQTTAPDMGISTYVFSRTLQSVPKGVTLVREDAAGFVRELKQRPGKDIILMGGGELAQTLMAADLVDEVGLNIHPILLGSGVPAFRDPGHRVRLKLKESRQLDGGCILATYDVQRTSP